MFMMQLLLDFIGAFKYL